jgi:DNA/RNA endonuclease G (NUC1)
MRGKTIGDNNVRVPEAFYKIIIDKNTKETVAFILPHREGLGNNIAKFQTTIAEVQNQTGIKFKFPKGVDLNDKPEHWEYSIKNLNNSKKAACKLY